MSQAATARARLITLQQALDGDRGEVVRLHERHLNPRMMKVYQFIGLDQVPVRAQGIHFWDAAGTRYTDLLSAFGTLAFGHNPPELWAALDEMRARGVPNLVEGPSPLASALAANLSTLAPGRLNRVYFANSGTEAVDAAVKLARSATGRAELIACKGAYHGRSIAALSVMDRREYRERFEPLLSDVHFVDFGDVDALASMLRSKRAAAVIIEPVQCEAGMVVPPPGYLTRARQICSETGALLIFDEIQCGLGRSGKLFACDQFEVVPDCLLLGKALGGGLMPLSALLTTNEIWFAGKGDAPQSPFHASTYAANSNACAVGLACLEMFCENGLIERATATGDYLRERLRDLQSRQPLIAEVRGIGSLAGIKLAVPGVLRPALASHPDGRYLLSSLLLKRLIREHRMVTSITLNNADVVRVQPPLNAERQVIDQFVEALEESLHYLRAYAKAVLNSVPDIVRFLRSNSVAGMYE
jgi:putrescine aminotransferase